MSLKDRLKQDSTSPGHGQSGNIFNRYGVMRNPFPPAGEPSGHPHMPTSAEEKIDDAVVVFHRDRTSQVLLIEGTQGVGKTNLLTFFQAELQDAYQDDKAFYIIRYYPDPESSFEGIIRRLFQELGESHLAHIGTLLASKTPLEREKLVNKASGHEFRLVLYSLFRTATEANTDTLKECSQLALEWLLGLRLVKRHREVLSVQFRLDTVESKTQALRDLVFCSSELGLLKGIFLLLDELEKQDYSVSKMTLLRYLSAIRALVDSLPRHLFLLVALTKTARSRYFGMLPALAGRLQNIVSLEPLMNEVEALDFARFYIEHAKSEAAQSHRTMKPGKEQLLSDKQIRKEFRELYELSGEKGLEGVSHRDFLNRLHMLAEASIAKV